MIKIIKKIFEANPERSTIVLKDNCSQCGCEVLIEITSTSGGFGLQGGVLLKCSPDEYLAKCLDCDKLNPKMDKTKVKSKRRKAQTNE